jgi:hypothetical protein
MDFIGLPTLDAMTRPRFADETTPLVIKCNIYCVCAFSFFSESRTFTTVAIALLDDPCVEIVLDVTLHT